MCTIGDQLRIPESVYSWNPVRESRIHVQLEPNYTRICVQMEPSLRFQDVYNQGQIWDSRNCVQLEPSSWVQTLCTTGAQVLWPPELVYNWSLVLALQNWCTTGAQFGIPGFVYNWSPVWDSRFVYKWSPVWDSRLYAQLEPSSRFQNLCTTRA